VEEAATLSEALPTSFLGKLNAVKARKGEATRLTLSTTGNEARLVATPADLLPSAAQDAVQETVHDSNDTAMGGT
jgi:hypothetical protein